MCLYVFDVIVVVGFIEFEMIEVFVVMGWLFVLIDLWVFGLCLVNIDNVMGVVFVMCYLFVIGCLWIVFIGGLFVYYSIV